MAASDCTSELGRGASVDRDIRRQAAVLDFGRLCSCLGFDGEFITDAVVIDHRGMSCIAKGVRPYAAQLPPSADDMMGHGHAST